MIEAPAVRVIPPIACRIIGYVHDAPTFGSYDFRIPVQVLSAEVLSEDVPDRTEREQVLLGTEILIYNRHTALPIFRGDRIRADVIMSRDGVYHFPKRYVESIIELLDEHGEVRAIFHK